MSKFISFYLNRWRLQSTLRFKPHYVIISIQEFVCVFLGFVRKWRGVVFFCILIKRKKYRYYLHFICKFVVIATSVNSPYYVFALTVDLVGINVQTFLYIKRVGVSKDLSNNEKCSGQLKGFNFFLQQFISRGLRV